MFRPLHRHNLVPAVFLVLGTALVATLGVISDRNDNERIALETSITAEQVRIRLQSCVDARINLVRTLADSSSGSPQQLMQGWATQAKSLYMLYGGVQALNYIDTEGVIRAVYPQDLNQPALNVDLRAHPNPSVVLALSRADSLSTPSRSNIVELLQSGKGFAIYHKIDAADGSALGFVNGVFRITDLMESCLPEAQLGDNFVFTMADGDSIFYQRTADIEPAHSPYLVGRSIDVAGLPWFLDFSPSKKYLDDSNSIVDEIWITLGLLLTVLLTLATRSLLIKQRDLKENQDNYRLLVENQTDMVVKVNPQGEFLYISPSYCDAFGKSEQELLGHHFMPLVHEADQELTRLSLESLNQPPHSSYHEQRAMTKEGWRWIGWSNTAVIDAQGNISAITAVGRDVTEIKKLESSVAHSQKMKALGEMAGGITHDFNNLLQVIYGNVEFILLQSEQDKASKARLERICQVVERAMSLTQKLSTLSRQEITQKEIFDLNEFSQDLLVLLEHTLPSSIHLSLLNSDQALSVDADKSLIEQVLLNICFNARDALESKGSIIITLGRKILDEESLGSMPDIAPGEYAQIRVKDDGCGIDADTLPRIFDPFFTTKGIGTGTGLGLANCYSIIKEHDGIILVDSSPGQGSCFSIYLPLIESLSQPGAADESNPSEQPIETGTS
ncbi:MAG: ATP-binding protein [Halieaceae bacterium]